MVNSTYRCGSIRSWQQQLYRKSPPQPKKVGTHQETTTSPNSVKREGK